MRMLNQTGIDRSTLHLMCIREVFTHLQVERFEADDASPFLKHYEIRVQLIYQQLRDSSHPCSSGPIRSSIIFL